MKSPIIYYGGKGTMSKKIIEYFPDNDFTTYIEAFAGSAAMLFCKKPSKIEVYNDLDKNVYSLFKVLSDKDLFKEFKELCDLSYYSKEISDEFKLDLKDNELSLLDRAYKFFYINRTRYNGVGSFSSKLIVRRNMSKSVSDFLSTIDRLPEIHQRISNAIIMNVDGIDLIKKYDKVDTFMYLDPPYHHQTRTSARYNVDMSDKNQINLITTLKSIKQSKILLSGYNNNLYNELLDYGFKRVDIEIKTQNTKREGKTKTESLWLNY